MSDFQSLGKMIDELDEEDWLSQDGVMMGPKQYASYIGRVMYNRRSKMNPLYNQFVIAGKKGDQPAHLVYVDHQGTMFADDFVATGFGSFLAMPILRNEWRADMSLEEAKALVIKCLQVCFYRDCRAYFKINIGVCDNNGVSISEPIAMDHFWGHTAWTEKRLEDTGSVADTW